MMGTNFYWLKAQKPPCECCGRPYEQESLHIGKSSAGWCFSLHVMPEDGINTLEDWEKRWAEPGSWIENEYGERVNVKEMRELITLRVSERKGRVPFSYRDWDDFYRENHAAPGPNGLVRHALDGRHCIGHGDGTWDYIVGEFS